MLPDDFFADQSFYLVRTDFSDETLWRHLLDDMNNVQYEELLHYDPGVIVVDDAANDGLGPEQLRRELSEGSRGVAIADATALTSPRHLILMTPYSPEDTPFRVPANAIGLVMDRLFLGHFWWELVLDVGDDGIIDVGISPLPRDDT